MIDKEKKTVPDKWRDRFTREVLDGKSRTDNFWSRLARIVAVHPIFVGDGEHGYELLLDACKKLGPGIWKDFWPVVIELEGLTSQIEAYENEIETVFENISNIYGRYGKTVYHDIKEYLQSVSRKTGDS